VSSPEACWTGQRGLAGDEEVEGEHHHVRARPGDSSAGPEAVRGDATTAAVCDRRPRQAAAVLRPRAGRPRCAREGEEGGGTGGGASSARGSMEAREQRRHGACSVGHGCRRAPAHACDAEAREEGSREANEGALVLGVSTPCVIEAGGTRQGHRELRRVSLCMVGTSAYRRTGGERNSGRLGGRFWAISGRIWAKGLESKLLTTACSPTFVKGARPLGL
jgi:hypothetical protein